MAAFTSAQTGDWNDGATWGNDSPGEKGTDWPGSAGDTAIISAGHTVTYNVSEANELGDITVNGKLSFSDVASRLLTLGDNDISVANGGELEIGTSGDEFDGSYTAEIAWNTTSDNTKGLQIANGGKLTVYGDSTYCSDCEDTLANDAENTDGDTTIKTVNDMSAIWHTGDELTLKVEKSGDATSHDDAIVVGTIQSMSGTSIVLDISVTAEAGVGDTWISPVVNVTRNVKLSKSGASTIIGDYNTNRPVIRDQNASGNNNCVISYGLLTGIHSIYSDNDFQFIESTIRNGQYGIYAGNSHTLSGNLYSNYSGLTHGNWWTFSGNIYACEFGSRVGYFHTISGNVYACSSGVTYTGYGHKFSGDIYGCYFGIDDSNRCEYLDTNLYLNYWGTRNVKEMVKFSGRIGYDGRDVSSPNVQYDFTFSSDNDMHLINTKMPLAGLTLYRNLTSNNMRIFSEDDNQVIGAQRIYDNIGDVIKTACDGTGDAPSVDPHGGNGYCVELSSVQSNCDSIHPLRAFKHRIWATSGVEKTYTYQVQTTYAGITAGNLRLTCSYLDGVSGASRTETTHAPAISQRSDNTDWSQTLTVTVTPGATGWLDLQVDLMEYEAGNEVYIWPGVGIS